MASPLTERETEILQLSSDGLSFKEVAYRLGISTTTVKNHLTALNKKYGTAGITEAVAMALRNGWIE